VDFIFAKEELLNEISMFFRFLFQVAMEKFYTIMHPNKDLKEMVNKKTKSYR